MSTTNEKYREDLTAYLLEVASGNGYPKGTLLNTPDLDEAFLADKAKEEGIVALDNGVLYRVLEEGHGTRKPTPRSIVYVHYTGRLIDGTVFEASSSRWSAARASSSIS